MNRITLRYKRPEWREWVVWPCTSLKEAEEIRSQLEADGYTVEVI